MMVKQKMKISNIYMRLVIVCFCAFGANFMMQADDICSSEKLKRYPVEAFEVLPPVATVAPIKNLTIDQIKEKIVGKWDMKYNSYSCVISEFNGKFERSVNTQIVFNCTISIKEDGSFSTTAWAKLINLNTKKVHTGPPRDSVGTWSYLDGKLFLEQEEMFNQRKIKLKSVASMVFHDDGSFELRDKKILPQRTHKDFKSFTYYDSLSNFYTIGTREKEVDGNKIVVHSTTKQTPERYKKVK